MPPYRIEWLAPAKAHIHSLDRATAMRIFDGVLRFARTGAGDVKSLHGDIADAHRLRVGDYRVLFRIEESTMRIFGVRHRSEAYR